MGILERSEYTSFYDMSIVFGLISNLLFAEFILTFCLNPGR